MTKARKKKRPEASGDKREELTIITGIGKATEELLGSALDIKTLSDLASSSADRIHDELRAHGRTTAKNRIDRWIKDAKDILKDRGRRAQPSDKAGDTEIRESKTRKDKLAERARYAQFLVDSRSPARDERSEEKLTIVEEVESEQKEERQAPDREHALRRAVDQIEKSEERKPELERPGEALTAEEPEAQAEPSAAVQPGGEPPVAVQITRVRAFQPPETEIPQLIGPLGGTCTGLVRGDEPVLFELSFQLAGPAAREVAQRHTRFNTAVYTYNPKTRAREHLRHTNPEFTEEGKLSYTTILSEAVLARGTYSLTCIASLGGTPPCQGHLKLPVFQVV